MKIGLFQSNIVWEDKGVNFAKYAEALKNANQQGIDILFLPEMSATGFSTDIGKTAELLDGETVSFFRSACKENNIACGFGYTEMCGEKALNKYSVCDKNGEIICDYVKIHPFSLGGESDCFLSGNSVSAFEMCGFKFSVFVCYDLRFPEIYQAASNSCDIIVNAANWCETRREHWLTLLRARAIENQCYICGVNRTGLDTSYSYSGDSVVFSPDGQLIANAEREEKIVYFVPDKTAITTLRNDFPLKRDRRPEFYKGLY